MDIGPSEAETFWTAFLRKLARRGLRGVRLVISDATKALRRLSARSSTPLGGAAASTSCVTFSPMRVGNSAASSLPSSPRVRLRRRRGRKSPMAPDRRPVALQAAQARRLPGRGRNRRTRLHDVPAAAPRQAALGQPNRAPPMARSSAAPRWSVSSPTRTPSPARSAPSCSSRTTSGPSSAPAT